MDRAFGGPRHGGNDAYRSLRRLRGIAAASLLVRLTSHARTTIISQAASAAFQGNPGEMREVALVNLVISGIKAAHMPV
jgi:hypothetical protein